MDKRGIQEKGPAKGKCQSHQQMESTKATRLNEVTTGVSIQREMRGLRTELWDGRKNSQ